MRDRKNKKEEAKTRDKCLNRENKNNRKVIGMKIINKAKK